MNSPNNAVTEIVLDGPASELTRLQREAPRPTLGVEALQYTLVKPRSWRHPLLSSAYELWRDGWRATLLELEGIARIHSDEFGRQDEIGALSIGGRCVSVTGLRWFDLSLAVAREDSYFQHWPADILRQLGSRLVGIPSNLVVHPEWRRTLLEPLSSNDTGSSAPLSQVSLALAIRRFIASPAELFIGVARNDRSMNRMAVAIGGTKIGQTIVHGVDSDLLCITREHAVPHGPVVDTLWERRFQECQANALP